MQAQSSYERMVKASKRWNAPNVVESDDWDWQTSLVAMLILAVEIPWDWIAERWSRIIQYRQQVREGRLVRDLSPEVDVYVHDLDQRESEDPGWGDGWPNVLLVIASSVVILLAGAAGAIWRLVWRPHKTMERPHVRWEGK